MTPLIRAFISGLIFLNSDHATVVEQLHEREPGTTTCPYFAFEATTQEYVYNIQGRTFCAWRLDADAPGQDQVIEVYVRRSSDVAAVVRGWSFNPTQLTQLNDVTWTACDLDLSGSFNVNDFVAFLNQPYDWNGDGSFNVNDFVAVLNGCGH